MKLVQEISVVIRLLSFILEMEEEPKVEDGKIRLKIKDHSLMGSCKNLRDRLPKYGFTVGEETLYHPDHTGEDYLLNVYFTT